MLDITPKPGHALGAYPQRDAPPVGFLESTMNVAAGPAVRRHRTRAAKGRAFLRDVDSTGKSLRDMSAAQLSRCTDALRAEMHRDGLRRDLSVRAFALVREVAGRTLGMRHFDCQIIGGWAILEGMLAEMDTGEGKTLTATLPACAAALAGIPVHVVTVNDYLATRDRELMAPLYAVLGIRAGVVTAELSDPAARRAAYACDVTYCTNKQLTFDYLRDRVAVGARRAPLYRTLDRLPGADSATSAPLLRGLCFAIVDEADSVLIDEARTPLKLSGQSGEALNAQIYRDAIGIAAELAAGTDYRVDPANGGLELLAAGQARSESLVHGIDPYFSSPRRRNAMIRDALVAQHLYDRDHHYMVRDGEVHIIDEYTGRAMPDRSWEMGLHQLIEAKEGLEITAPAKTLARITYQRFFRRYLKLGAISGTAREVSGELWSVYGLAVYRVPSNRPSRRQPLPMNIHVSNAEKWRDIAERAVSLRNVGRPVLIGTRTLAASETISALLTAAGVDHELLNARQDCHEAEIIARAGQAGQITVATNMAGRGTDIKLAEGIATAGGLHVIVAERNDARRIDRQLFGRCGRQGDPGSYEAVWSWSEDSFLKCAPRPVTWLANNIISGRIRVGIRLAKLVMRFAQYGTERGHARLRRSLLKHDQRLDDVMAFSGPVE